MEEKFGIKDRVCKFRKDNDCKILLYCGPVVSSALVGALGNVAHTHARCILLCIILAPDGCRRGHFNTNRVDHSENSTRFDKQIKRGGVINLDYETDLGQTLLLRGHVQKGLFVACTDNEANSSMFFGCLQPGWATAYVSKSGAGATFGMETRSAVAAELAKLGMPELSLMKLAKKGVVLCLTALHTLAWHDLGYFDLRFRAL
jgi:hypothetical protein